MQRFRSRKNLVRVQDQSEGRTSVFFTVRRVQIGYSILMQRNTVGSKWPRSSTSGASGVIPEPFDANLGGTTSRVQAWLTWISSEVCIVWKKRDFICLICEAQQGISAKSLFVDIVNKRCGPRICIGYDGETYSSLVLLTQGDGRGSDC